MPRSAKAFTRLELLLVIAGLIVGAGFVLAMLARRGPKISRLHCINNLKNIGLGFRIFATDNKDQFPWEFSTNSGGTRELRGNIVAQFSHVSNELPTMVLICPERIPAMKIARDFAHLSSSNIGYFINLSASESKPDSLLVGDAGFQLNHNVQSTARGTIVTNPTFSYPKKFHLHDRPPTYVTVDGSANYFRTNSSSDHRADFQATNEILVP